MNQTTQTDNNIHRLLDDNPGEIDDYDEKPLRKDELEALLELFGSMEIPDTDHPLA